MNEKKKLKVKVLGTVQGVGFRQFTLRVAQNLGVLGWVKNEPDGSVLILAIAPQQQLDAFLSEVRKGPRHSLVKSLEQKSIDGETDQDSEFTSFEVIR